MDQEERLLWAMLVEAESFHNYDGHKISCLIRVKLRDKFGINLDTLSKEALVLVLVSREINRMDIE